MKTNRISQLLVLAFFIVSATSCKKEVSSSAASTSSSAIAAAIANNQAIAVGTTSLSSTSAADSIYIINTCSPDSHRDSVDFNSLPPAIGTYLTSNYAGYAFQKAFVIKDRSGNVQGYVVVIVFNGNPVGLKFDSTGNFLKVLEQREGRDLDGPGWHSGGHFDDRDGKDHDTISFSGLPSAVQTYFNSNYSNDTIVKAFVDRDSSYIIISRNNGVFATVFDATGAFVKRVQLPSPHEGKLTALDQNSLPATILTYLTSTYPSYTFKQAFSVSFNNVIQGYIVFINANSTKYAIEFDASGNFLKAITVR